MNNNISFGSQQLYYVNLIQKLSKGTKIIPAYFSEMDDADVKLIKRGIKDWNVTRYGEYIIDRFLYDRMKNPNFKYYMIEEANSTSKNKVKALALVRLTKREISLEYLQSANKLEIKNAENIKGGGTMIIYGLAKLLKELKKEAIMLCPSMSARAFYKKLGFVEYTNSSLILESDKAQRIIKKIEDKFDLRI